MREIAVGTNTQTLGLMGCEEAQLNMSVAKIVYRTLLDEIAGDGQGCTAVKHPGTNNIVKRAIASIDTVSRLPCGARI